MKATAHHFKGVSDPTRLGIIGLLLEHQELCVCDLIAALNLPQSTISRHLAYLKRSGWLVSRQQGLWIHYRLAEVMKVDHATLLTAVAAELSKSGELSEIRERLTSFRSRQASSC